MNGDMNYSIKTSKGKKGRFKIHPKTGQVYTNKALSPGKTFDLMVQAKDNGQPQLSTSTRVLVRVARVPVSSEHAPTLTPPPPAHVMETDLPGHLVSFITAHDPDNDTLWYYITEGDDSGRFSMGVDTGLVTLARRLDHEDQYHYSLTISATDGVHTTTTKLVVSVMDANDHRPVFSARVYSGSVSEAATPGTSILTLQCRDRDQSPSAVYFTLHHAHALASHGLFSLDSTSGDLTVAQPLDREVCGVHELTVSCRDRGRRENADFARVTVTVLDANDHDPTFLDTMITAKVSVGTAAGTVVTRVLALDHDKGENGRLSYSIVEGNAGGTFSMDPALGTITLTRELTKPDPAEFLLLVRATDHAKVSRATSVPVTVMVTSWQVASPVWPEHGRPQVVEISEWAEVGTAVARLSAHSPSPLHYALTGGDDTGMFVVSPASGVVSLARRLDYETCAWYNLTVTATSMVGSSQKTCLGVTVLDENDWWPEWENLVYYGTVLATAEPKAPVLTTRHHHHHNHHPTPLTVTAHDRDQGFNGRVTYSFVERHIARLFTVDQYTGAVRVAGSLEEVAGTSIEFSVWASDGGEPKRECIAPATVIISIKSVNVAPTAFPQSQLSATLYLPTFPGVRVFCLDQGQATHTTNPLKYSITEGDDTKRFKFDDESKCMTVHDHLNLKSHYNLTLEATDSISTLTTSATAEITVEDAPLSTIIFTQEKYWANVMENSTKEVNVVALGVKGQPLNHHVRYSILNPSDKFVIHPTAGVIKTTGKLFDREAQDHYTLVVQAMEEEEPDNLAHVLVYVAVMDVNDNEPMFLKQPYLSLVSTSAARGHVLAKVLAVDTDAGDFGSIRYELVRGSGELFSVNKKTGEISLKQSLMVADKMYSLTVAAYDGGMPPLSSQTHVMIRVVAADGPMFTAGRYEASVGEDAPDGTPVVRVDAASPSGEPVLYTIVGGNTDQLFSIDFATGVVQTAARLDYEVTHSHNLTVRARDPVTGSHTDAHVAVKVTDVNDNPPEFTKYIFKGEVSEAAAPGHEVLKVVAQDVDTGVGGQVHYTCGMDCGPFEVRGEDGAVVVASKLDTETQPQHTLTVMATDAGQPQLSSTATVIVYVLDFNDNPPAWRQDSYSCRVSSEAQPGHVVTAMSAHDPDTSQISPLTYAIHSGDRSGIFRIDPLTGVVVVTAPHKLANLTSLNLNMSVSDGVHVVFTGLHVAVVPSNHHAPRFSQPLYEARVMENSDPKQLVLSLEATDPDTGGYGALKYNILHQTSEAAFTIDKEGNIFTESPLDREAATLHTLKLSVTDEGGRANFVEVRITVQDKNDNAPVFTLPEYQGNINTDAAPGTTILKVEASDADEGVNSEVEYHLYEANSSEALTLFRINPSTGIITLARGALGLENEVYQFFIRGEDGGSPRHRADVPITIFLLPANDPPPRCPRKYAQFFLWENEPVGTVVTTLWTDGPQKVKYSIQSVGEDDEQDDTDASGSFSVSESGLVAVRRPLDHERRRTHHIIVTNQTLATPPALDYMTVSVVVMDVNDCSPRFSASSYRAVVAENSEVGATITILTATDEDEGNNGQVQYNFASDEDATVRSIFHIDPHSGAVTLAATLDREATSMYSFTVVATDGGPEPLSSSARVTVMVQDYNDNPPVFTRDTYITAVPEDTATGTAVVELSVQDADQTTAQLDYFVTGGDSNGHFLVHTSGQVYVAAALDREEQAEYILTVTATDGKFTANTSVSVTVIDVNDNGPVCQEPVYQREVSEGVSPGTHVVSVVAWDADEGAASRSRYSLTGEGAEHFTIDQLSGHVSTATQLDREAWDYYQLTVVVADWEQEAWQCEVALEVTITDTNDNPPNFGPGTHTTTLPEDAPVNTVLLKMLAIDPDLGTNRRVRYNLVDSADGHFTIDETEGVVSLARPLDRETRDTYTLTVRAVDQGSPPLSATTHLTVTVSDINDNAPEFVRKLHETTVAENTAVGTEVLRVMATSRDIGINAEVTYSLQHTTKEEYLIIHPKTGVISIGATVDYEHVQQVVATVVATDGGTPPLSATALVNLTVTDVNDNAPVFTLPTFTASVREDSLQGASVVQISASDIDSGVNSLVRYSILDGNQDHCFTIDEDSGIVTLMKKLDREKVGHYQLRVGARDLGTPSNTAMAQLEVTVVDVNDNPPIFTQDNYTVVVQENRLLGSSLMRLLATDADADPNGAPFTWELITQTTDTSTFTLAQDGSLRLATTKLDHRVQDKYTVHVRVWDSGSPPMHAETQVTVKVVEESRYPPTIFPLSAVVISYRTAFPGGIIGRVTALDQDPYDTLQYSITPSLGQVSSIKYFDIDGQDGTLVALMPLDSGTYNVNVSVSDGRYHRDVQVTLQVSVITNEMVDNSIIVRMGPLSSDDFLTRYLKIFIQAVASELNTNDEAVTFVSLQPSLLLSHSMENIDYNPKRSKRDIQRSLELLFVVKNPDGSFIPRRELLLHMNTKLDAIQKRLDLPLLTVMNSLCTTETDCSGHGACTDVVDIREDVAVPFNTQVSSLVAPRFSQRAGCLCDQGYGGDVCDILVNACGHRPCAEYEECRPTNTSSRGYTCQCPQGRAGPSCQVDLTKCRHPSCHYPLKSLSFTGKSYAQYSIARQAESSSLVLSTFMRTKNSVGTLVFAGGDVDYSVLEVAGGHVQYRWDCGSGEGLVRVSTVRVNNDQWHFINLTREGTISTLSVNGEVSSGAAPGANDVLNIDSDFIYLGARMRSDQGSGVSSFSQASLGFVGCLDQVTIGGVELPVAMTGSSSGGAILKRLANVELQCPALLPDASVCGSYPCLNGGTCSESGKSYKCTCPPRFTGSQCQVDTAPCSSSPCLNGGKCIVVGHSYKCQCPSKLSGKRCEYGVYCNPNPCENGGRCEEGADGPMCKCQHFTGAMCQLDIDECTRNPCQNGGTCLNFYGGFKCICSSNVTGEYCTEALQKPPEPSSALNLTLEELMCVLAVFLGFVVAALLLAAWQRRRCRTKRHHQNNTINLTDYHVKNDLKANDAHKRNSKICNVEADQGPPLPPRPASYTPSGTDSVLLSTLKQLADLSAAGHESLELETFSQEFLHSLKPVVAQASLSPPPLTNCDSEAPRKPWDHHNNLNDSYFTPIKDVGCDLVTNLGDSRPSPGQQSPSSDDSSAPPNQQKKGYHWDRYDLRGSRSLLTCADPGDATPDLLLLAQDTHAPAPAEAYPLLPPAGGEEGEGAAGSEATAATPLLSVDARDSQEVYDDDEDNDDDDDDDDDDDPCSFEEILLANNITLGSTPDLALHLCPNYNMISELEDDEPPPPPPPPSNKVPLSPAKTSNLPAASEDVNKLGSPRSRRPFHRRDYSRVSDVSFLSALEEECVDESFSEPQDSDWEPPNDLNDPQAAKLIQTSLSEVYL
ncbi:hypothetical protein Pmani_025146 [Petrolisthes manimaculis]|uniref:Uncharacterized protein n=1 Tax=Petrolisthes manimaculis TaxID=1843537 RepID=A0AAE1P663_9EUCA|nr:hypothetical protein Pmani_025146 [Petrolisthes manimaculis]